MTGFWALARKEILEQRRSWKFVALAGIFTALALLTTIIPFIVMVVRDHDRGIDDAREVLRAFGFLTVSLGTLLAIIVSMGSLANERASGTAAMTLSKPVTRLAFVSAKFLGIVVSIFAALAIASAIEYVLTLFMFDNGGLVGFARFMAIIGVYLVFIGSIAFFWSGMFSRHLLAGGITLAIFIAFLPLSEIPHTQRYWPVNTVEWAERSFRDLGGVESPIDEEIILPIPVSSVRGGERGGFEDGTVIVEGAPAPEVRVEERDSSVDGAVPIHRGPIDRSPLTLQRFQQLRVELADLEDIDGLTPRISLSESVGNPESRRHERMVVTGIDPRYLEGFGDFTFTSGGEARLEDLAEDQLYINEPAAKDLDAEAGDRLLLSALDEEVTVNVRGVVKPHALAGFGLRALIMPLQRAQAMFRWDDQITGILVSNRGSGNSGSGLSEEVTRELRVRLADRQVVSQLKELLGQEAVLKALKRMEKNLGGNGREDLSQLREELQRERTSDKFIGLLAEPNMASFVMVALDRDGLDDVLQEAGPLFTNQAEFQVVDFKRRPFNPSSAYWSAFAIAGGSIVLLSLGAWGVFRRKEL